MSKISAVPTNIITGFLGAGKTSTILHLLKQKPYHERWAVLVNEFGEVGIDGAMLTGQKSRDPSQVFIQEVPGGCMCCAAGLPMQIALNKLLKQANPDRLLIEPTGLGHPKEILQVLNDDSYRDVLDIHRSLVLVDARKLADGRYTSHEIFNQQIDIADIVIGNKRELYDETDIVNLRDYIARRKSQEIPIVLASHGNIDPALLEGASVIAQSYSQNSAHHHHHSASNLDVSGIDASTIPEAGFVVVQNEGEGFKSIGWRFAPDIVFERNAIFTWLNGIHAERLKAVFITYDGIFAYNLADNIVSEMELDEVEESRVEIIALQIQDLWQDQMLALAGLKS